MKLESVGAVAAQECIRQEVGLKEYAQLISAYHFTYSIPYEAPLDLYRIKAIARQVEPVKAMRYRMVPVTFPDMGGAVAAPLIENAMRRICKYVNDVKGDPNAVYFWVKNFLEIHPYRDGNGRIAWILYNYLMGYMDDPSPLPKFHFHNLA